MALLNRPEPEGERAPCIAAVAFDMDGLMVNTETLYTLVGSIILERRGRKFTPELKRRMMGLPGEKAFSIMIEYHGLEDSVSVLARESDDVFLELLPGRLQVMPGLLKLLDHLDELGLPRCVATSSTRTFADQVLQQVALHQRVDFVITAGDVANGKPAPDIYLAAAKRMQVAIANLLVLEDSQHGATAGIRAGACTVAVPERQGPYHDFTGAYLIADTLADPRIRGLMPTQRTP